MTFGGSDLFDKFRPSSNDGAGWIALSPPSVPSDRRHGARWPIWRTQQELDILRQEARLRLAGNAYAQGLLRNLTNNVIGKGFAYTVMPLEKPADKLKRKAEEAGQDADAEGEGDEEAGRVDPGEALAAKVQECVDEFLRLNNWNGGTHPSATGVVVTTREREIFRRVKGEDGECFLRFHFQPDGKTLVRFIEPELVRDLNGIPQDGWSYGIQHQMNPFEDVETPVAYRVFWPDPSATGGEGENNGYPEDIPADEVLHIRGPDTPATVKRGLSPFLFDVGKSLDRASRLQRNASLGAAYRAATGEIWQHHTGTQQQIVNLAQTLGENQQVTDPRTGSLETIEPVRPPMVRRIPDSQEMVPLPPDQSESYLAAGQGDLRQAASAFAAPEFWMAETSSGNYSNLESAAAPAVRDGQTEQEYYKQAFCAAIWKAVMWAVECGDLPSGVEDKVKLEVEAPAVLHRNELEKAQEDQIGVSVGWKDRQTCAEERGLDWEKVQERNQEYNDQQLEQQADAQDMLGMPGEDEGPPAQGGPPGKGGGPKPPPFGQSVKEGFDAAEPRDDSGQWTSGGGGKSKAAVTQARKQAHRQAGQAARKAWSLWSNHEPLPSDHPYFENIDKHLGNAITHSWGRSLSDLTYRHEELVRAREGIKQVLTDGGLKPRQQKALEAMLAHTAEAAATLLRVKKEAPRKGGPVRESAEAPEHGDGWKTLDNGTHVYIKGGEITAGPEALTGRRLADLGHKVTAHHGDKHPVTGEGPPDKGPAADKGAGGEAGKKSAKGGKMPGRYSHLKDLSLSDIIRRRDELETDIRQLATTASAGPGGIRNLQAEIAQHNLKTLRQELHKVNVVFYKKAAEHAKTTGDREGAKTFERQFRQADKSYVKAYENPLDTPQPSGYNTGGVEKPPETGQKSAEGLKVNGHTISVNGKTGSQVFKELQATGVSDAYQEGFEIGWSHAANGRQAKDRAALDADAKRQGLDADELDDNATGYAAGHAARTSWRAQS